MEENGLENMDTALIDFPDAWNEVDQLISQLQMWGITYLVGLEHAVGSPAPGIEQLSPVALIERLAQCDEYPRVRDASISLFLLHPELADMVEEVLRRSEAKVAEQIAVLTLATLYLQRLWSIRLTLALGHPPCFPEQQFAFLWRKHKLPPPASYFGKWGLAVLQDAEQRRTGLPFTFLGDWQNQVDRLLQQEEAKHHRILVAPTVLQDEQREQECSMSMRPSVDKRSIEAFLQQLGRTFSEAGSTLSCRGCRACPRRHTSRVYPGH